MVMSRKRHIHVDTFPFLAVLLCAMGSLILLLLVFDRRAKVVARARAAEVAAEAAAKKAKAGTVDEEEWQRKVRQLHEILVEQQLELQNQLRAILGNKLVTVKRIQDEEMEIVSLHKAIGEQKADLEKKRTELAIRRGVLGKANEREKAAQKDLERFACELDQLERTLHDLQALKRHEKETYSLVPYHGKHGANRKPIYVECAGYSLVFHPGGKSFSPLSVSPAEFLAEVVRLGGKIPQQTDPDKEPDSAYVLFLVRPNGIVTYYKAQALMKELNLDYGYEFVEADWVFDFGGEGNVTPQPWQAAGSGSGNRGSPSFGPVALGSGPGGSGSGFGQGTGSGFGPALSGPGNATGGGPGNGNGGPGGSGSGVPGAGWPHGNASGTGQATGTGIWQGSGGSGGGATGIPGTGQGMGTGIWSGTGGPRGGSGFSGPSSGFPGTGQGSGWPNGGASGIPGTGQGPGSGLPGTGSGISGSGPGSGSGMPGTGQGTGWPNGGGSGISGSGRGSGSGIPGTGQGSGWPNGGGSGIPGTGQGSGSGNSAIGQPNGWPNGGGQGNPGSGQTVANSNTTGQGFPSGQNGNGTNSGGGSGVQGTSAGPWQPSSGVPGNPGVSRNQDPSSPGNPFPVPVASNTRGQNQDYQQDQADLERQRRLYQPGGGNNSGGGSGQAIPLGPASPLANFQRPEKATRPNIPLGRLIGNRDFILVLECTRDAVILQPWGTRFPLATLPREPDPSHSLVRTVQQLINRRQATVQKGETPYRPMIRFQIRPDGLRAYYLAYPLLEGLRIPMMRENADP
jgi:hypothetical protein